MSMLPEQTTPTTTDSASQDTSSTSTTATNDSVDTSSTEDQYEMPSEEFELPAASNDDEAADDDEATSTTDDDTDADADQDDAGDEDQDASTTDPSEIVIDGVKLTPAEAKEALAAYKQKTDWQRAFTQRDQKLAADQKAWQASIEQKIAQGLTKTKTDEELAAMTPEERQTDAWLAKRGFVRKEDVQAAINQAISPFVKDMETIRQNEGSRQILQEAEKLMSEYGLNEDEVMSVAKFAQDNQMIHRPLKDSYILMNKDNIVAAQAKAKEDQTKKIAARKKAASRSLKPNGSDGMAKPDGLDYDPAKHGKMSYKDLARSVR